MELARCLGLSVRTLYHVKEVQEPDDIPAPEPDIPTAEIPGSAISGDTALRDETPKESTLISDYSVPILMLPPRKRLKASHCSTFGGGDTVGSMADVTKSGYAEEKDGDSDLRALYGSEDVLSVIRPDVTMAETVGVSVPSVTGVSTFASDVAVATNMNSTAKNSFASLTAAMCRAKLAAAQKEPARHRRKSRQTTGPATNPQPAAVSRDWAATNGGGGVGVVPPTVPPVVAVSAPTPHVIHIPEDARVLRTDDGMIIVCQSDGTVQIHGHTEGQPIPLDAIRSLLALDSTGDQTLLEVSDCDSKQICQEAGHSMYSQSIPLASLQTEYETSDQILGTVVDTSADGTQFMPMDGSQTLLAYDPNTQSVVQIDPGQGYITLSDDNTFVAVDGTQQLLSIGDGYHAEQAVVPNTALIHLLPNDHMQ